MGYRATIGDRHISITPRANGHERLVSLDGHELHIDWQAVGESGAGGADESAVRYSALIGEHSYEAYARRVHDDDGSEGPVTFEVTIAGRPYLVTVEDE